MAPQFSERISRLRPSIVREILAAARAPGVISFAGGLPANESFPALNNLTLPPELGQYGPTEGDPALRHAVSAYLTRAGLECPPERILILSGSQQGIDLVAKLFVDVGTPVVTESPTYLAALQVFELFGASLHGVSLAEGGPVQAEFERVLGSARARLCYLNPTFQNPTGKVYDDATRARVAAALDLVNVPLFEDDPYRELAFSASAPAPIAGRLRRAPWVYQSSFSKLFMPGIRLGFLAASEELFVPLQRLKQAADLHSSCISQWLALGSLADAGADRRLETLRSIYRGKRDVFERALTRHFGDIADWKPPKGGMFFWVRLKQPRSLVPLLKGALERGVAFVPGEVFFPEPIPEPGYMRLNFSHAKPEQVDEGLLRLANLIRESAERSRDFELTVESNAAG